MRLITFNVNSVRSRMEILLAFLRRHQPDFVGLQEIKTQNPDFPLEPFQALGYHCLVHGQKTHHGVALLSKIEPTKQSLGFPWSKDQARIIYGQFTHPKIKQPLHLFNVYFPNGEQRSHPQKFPYKLGFFKDFYGHLKQNFQPTDAVAIFGDFNIAPKDEDIGIGEVNRIRWLKAGKCSFLPEEREVLAPFFSWGLKDSYRALNPEKKDIFSWFDYRSKGFEDTPKRGLRIDYALLSEPLAKLCNKAEIDYVTRGQEKPSDHCPVIYDFAV